MASIDTSIPSLLSALNSSLESAISSVPDSTAILPPKNGISLLDTKNELLLSYLQNLVFLILVKLRNGSLAVKSGALKDGEENNGTDTGLGAEAVKKLVELRLYLEKGVRPLEGRLKYQIDKVLRAAGDAAREHAQKANGKANGTTNGHTHSDSDTEDQDSDDNSDDDSDDDDKRDRQINRHESTAAISDLSYRPNPSSFARPAAESSATKPFRSLASETGLYRPPRITPTALPTTGGPKAARSAPSKSRTLDEFLETELSSAPAALPSIGSTIVSGGRRSKSDSERKAEAERAAYEEANFVRLPKPGRKEKGKGRRREDGYGGEEWRGLGEGVDRIERLTRRKTDGGSSALLERSRKRKEGGPSGRIEVGERFENKRRKVLEGRRDRGRR